MQVPTENLNKMAAPRDASAWLRTIRKLLRAHQERQNVFEELSREWRLFPHPDKQVYSVGSMVLRVNFQFPVPAERRLQKSFYDLFVWALFAGDCSVLPRSTMVFNNIQQRMSHLEAVLDMVRDTAAEIGLGDSPRPRFQSPLLELVRDWWWDALSSALTQAEAVAAAEATPLPQLSLSPRSPSPSTSVSSFSSPIPSPRTLRSKIVRRNSDMSSSPPLERPAYRQALKRASRRTIPASRSSVRSSSSSESWKKRLGGPPASRRSSERGELATSPSTRARSSSETSRRSSSLADLGSSSSSSSSGGWVFRRGTSTPTSRHALSKSTDSRDDKRSSSRTRTLSSVVSSDNMRTSSRSGTGQRYSWTPSFRNQSQ